jgi:hypothetical protein
MRHATPNLNLRPPGIGPQTVWLSTSAILCGAILALSAGCSLVVGTEVPAECARSADCPADLRCDPNLGRCMTSLTGDRDAEVVLDVGFDLGFDLSPDLEPPRDLDLTDAAPPDAAEPPPDQGPSPFGAEGDCFPGQRRGAISLGAAVSGVPGVFCTAQAFGYTQSGPEGVAVFVARAPGARIDSEPLVILPRGSQPMFEGDALLYARPGTENEPARVLVVGLADGAERALLPEDVWPDRAQRQPFAVPGARGLVVQGAQGDADSRVVLVRETTGGPRRVDCAVSGQGQWGPVAGAGYAAWFGRTARTGRTELFLSLRADCQAPVAAPLPTPIDRDTRLHAAGPYLVYLADDPLTGGRHRYLLDRRAPGEGVFDLDTGTTTRHAEIQAAGAWLATARYTPAGNRVEALQLEPERSLSLTPDADMRNPSLSNTFLLWAAQAGGRWSLAYQALEER